MPLLTRAVFVLATVGLVALIASPVSAHAFGQRYDLPIPLNYFLIGAVAAVALSFVVLGMFVQKTAGQFKYPRLDLFRTPVVGPILSSRIASAIVRTLSVAIFILLILAGFIGTNRPIDNISPTFIWIIWWVGVGYVVALFGNVWMAVNPWKITFEWYQRLTGSRGRRESPPFKYPDALEVWPALVLFFVFAWAENVFTGAFRPMTLSVMVVLYSIVMWAGMAAFGKHTWLRHGEAFHGAVRTLLAVLAYRGESHRQTTFAVAADSDCADESECIDCHECYRAGRRCGKGAEPAAVRSRPGAQGADLDGYGGICNPRAVVRDLRRLSGHPDVGELARGFADNRLGGHRGHARACGGSADVYSRLPGLLMGNPSGVRRPVPVWPPSRAGSSSHWCRSRSRTISPTSSRCC